MTRLQTKGTVLLLGKQYEVQGLSWMDHEFFTHQLASDQTGWDWLSLQLNDGGELMLFQLRRKDGSIDPYSAGTMIDRAGNARHLTSRDFTMIPGRTWKSAKSGGVYPVEWSVSVLGEKMTVKTLLDKQEITGTTNYWEGAIQVAGDRTGGGYLEMTGYDKPIDLR
jgi:predicted secreted hydrolase